MKRRVLAILSAGVLGAGILAGGCGGKDSSVSISNSGGADYSFESMDTAEAAEDMGVSSELQEDQSYDRNAAEAEEPEHADAALDGSDTAKAQDKNEKRIYTYRYSVETKEFDVFMANVAAKVEKLGGYVQDSETSGSAVDNINRSGNMTLRIPADHMNQMLSMVKQETNVLYSNVSTENVTLNYVDMESHIKALRAEQATLLRLMEKAEKIEDVIALQSQLTQVRYEIESFESQLRTMDNLVEYSTLHLDISEVERTTTVASTKMGFWEEAASRFSDNLYGVGRWLRGAAVWLIGSLPVLVLLAAALAAVIIIWRKREQRRKKNLPEQSDTQGGYRSIYQQKPEVQEAENHADEAQDTEDHTDKT